MSWFGWLTKGHYEVTFLDRLTCMGEVLAVVLVYFVVAYVWWSVSRMFKKKAKR